MVTVDAIFVATVQLLPAEGAARLTTTRIARRESVSIGTMYQYFPNKHALLQQERDAPEASLAMLRAELPILCRAYLAASSTPRGF